MRRLLSLFALLILTIAFVPSVTFAAKPIGEGFPKPPTALELVGYDISYPQCGKRLPTDHYFAIIGINGGNAATNNPCLAEQLEWANKAKTGSNQPRVQLYVNTANPGEVISDISTWPKSPYDNNGNLPANPYGSTCDGDNDEACSWLYGWNRSIYTEGIFMSAAASKGYNTATSAYVWWLDVETMNTWQSGSNDALVRNTAALEGFAKYYQSKQANVGLYSTAVQWSIITGNNTGLGNNLKNLPNWRPSGASLTNAINNCNVAPLTPGGYISLTQYVQKNLDFNHSCI
jgi:hypothetical protein